MDAAFFGDSTRQAVKSWAAQRDIALGELTRILEGSPANAMDRRWSLAPKQQPTVYFPGLRASPFWDVSNFPWASQIEAAVDSIRTEYTSCLSLSERTRLSPSFRTDGGNWSVRYITCIGRFDKRALQHYPSTVEALSSPPGALGCGMTYFSSIAPNTHILPHSGFTNAHLRCHLALSTSEGCRIRVDGETRSWASGKLLIFDDTFEHEVWNESSNARVVLLFDVFHPDLSVSECRALEFLASVWRRTIMLRGLYREMTIL